MMKISESKGYVEAVKAVTKVDVESFQTIREGILFANLLEGKKGDVYLAVMEAINTMFPFTVEKVVSPSQPKGVYKLVRKGTSERPWPEGGLLAVVINDFPEYPVEVIDGKPSYIPFTKAQALARDGKLDEQQTVAVQAINRFNSWASGWALQVVSAHIKNIVETETAKRVAELQAEATAKGTPIIDAELEKRAKKIRDEVAASEKASREQKGKSLSIIDAKGHVKTTTLENLPISAKEELAKALSAVTGKEVKAMPKLADLRASVLIAELKNHLSDFKVPTAAASLIESLEAMLIENHEPVSTGASTVKVKGHKDTEQKAA